MGNIFDNIVRKENDHTELLCNLLRREPEALRAILAAFLKDQALWEDSTVAEIQSQVNFTEGIPDIEVQFSDVQMFIEVKVDPKLPLSEPQRGGYEGCFNSDSRRYIAYLVPQSWIGHVTFPQIKTDLSLRGISAFLILWTDLVKLLTSYKPRGIDALWDEAIRYWLSQFEVIQMTSEERQSLLWPSSFSALRKLQDSVKQTKRLFDTRAPALETRFESSPEESGFFLLSKDRYLAWLGIWEKAASPLCLGVKAGAKGWAVPKTVAGLEVIQKNWYMLNFEEAVWDDPEELFRKVNTFLKEQYGVLDNGLPGSIAP